jgi:hypothetical protein
VAGVIADDDRPITLPFDEERRQPAVVPGYIALKVS